MSINGPWSKEKFTVSKKRPSSQSLPSEGWGLCVKTGPIRRVPHSAEPERGDSARKFVCFFFLSQVFLPKVGGLGQEGHLEGSFCQIRG
jgi:hypothetical protein